MDPCDSNHVVVEDNMAIVWCQVRTNVSEFLLTMTSMGIAPFQKTASINTNDAGALECDDFNYRRDGDAVVLSCTGSSLKYGVSMPASSPPQYSPISIDNADDTKSPSCFMFHFALERSGYDDFTPPQTVYAARSHGWHLLCKAFWCCREFVE